VAEIPTIVCPKCQKRYPLKEELIGKKVKCSCGTQFRAVADKVPVTDPPFADDEHAWPSEPFPDELLCKTPATRLHHAKFDTSPAAPALEPVTRKDISEEDPKGETHFSWRQQALYVGAVFLLLGVGNMICLQFGLSVRILSKLGADSPPASLMLACAGGVLVLAAQIRTQMHFIAATLISIMFIAGAAMYEFFPSPATGRRQTQRIREKMREEQSALAAREQQLRDQREAHRAKSETAEERKLEQERDYEDRLRDYERELRQASRNVEKEFQLTNIVGGSGGGDYLFVDEDLRPVLRFYYAIGDFDGPALNILLPIYDREILVEGDQAIIAKPGYAVSGIQVNADKYVRAVKVTFARLVDDKLVTADSFEAEWIGQRSDDTTQMLGHNGSMVLGVYGGQGLILDSLGLVTAEK
jgi:hypothetical protein